MRASATVRKAVLVAHVVSSVGWLGGALCATALAVTAVRTGDDGLARAIAVAMEPLAANALVPLAGASMVTGVVQSLITRWGLLRHWWVVFKLAINVVAGLVLVVYLDTLTALADTSASTTGAGPRSGSPVLHAAVGAVLLVAATVLSVFKPRGLTTYGWRRQQQLA